MKNLNAKNLKNELWEVLIQVKGGDMQANQADAIATQAREIIRTTNLQLRISSQAKRDIPIEVINFGENKE